MGDLVLEAFFLVVRERQVRRIGANAKHLTIDEVGAVTLNRERGNRQRVEKAEAADRGPDRFQGFRLSYQGNLSLLA